MVQFQGLIYRGSREGCKTPGIILLPRKFLAKVKLKVVDSLATTVNCYMCVGYHVFVHACVQTLIIHCKPYHYVTVIILHILYQVHYFSMCSVTHINN